jgi:hypothetical protein
MMAPLLPRMEKVGPGKENLWRESVSSICKLFVDGRASIHWQDAGCSDCAEKITCKDYAVHLYFLFPLHPLYSPPGRAQGVD